MKLLKINNRSITDNAILVLSNSNSKQSQMLTRVDGIINPIIPGFKSGGWMYLTNTKQIKYLRSQIKN